MPYKGNTKKSIIKTPPKGGVFYTYFTPKEEQI